MNLRNASKLTLAAALLGAAAISQPVVACTTAAWSETTANVLASGPAGPDGKAAIARYSGQCAMQTADGAVSYVQDNTPAGINRIRARFYVLLGNNADGTIYEGYAAGGAPVFSVDASAAGVITLSSASGGSPQTSNANAGAWNSVEIDWDPAGGGATLTVNENAPVNFAPAGSPTAVGYIRLGNLDGVAGAMNFDSYESRRTTAVGQLCDGDADQSGLSAGVRDFSDLSAIFVELATAGNSPANGTPDANRDGVVDFADLSDVFVLIATAQGNCS